MDVFYRKYRPQKLSDLFGQDHVKKTLLAQLESGKISHGYLFAGPKGTGKTSTARIFAKAVNCQQLAFSNKSLNSKLLTLSTKFGEPCNKCPSCLSITDGSNLDLIEIDAASNRGIDEIRDLREKIKLSPVSLRFKVYIIDEAHMLTNEAFNALLKTLEEPPAHAIFILCTTEPAKLPTTIISRLARLNFKRAQDEEIAQIIKKIAQRENIKIEKEAIDAIISASEGSFRDATLILDQLSASSSKIESKDVKKLILVFGPNQIFEFVRDLFEKDTKGAIEKIKSIQQSGGDIMLFAKEVVLLLEKLLLLKIGATQALAPGHSDMIDQLQQLSKNITIEDIQEATRAFLISQQEMKLYPLPHIPLVLAVVKYCMPKGENQKREVEIEVSPSQDKEISSQDQKVQTSEMKITPKNKSSKSLSQIEAAWGEFLAKVKPINAHVVALLRSTKPTYFDGVSLTLEVFYKFHKEKLEDVKIRTLLENVLSEITKDQIRLNFILVQKSEHPPKAVSKSDVVEINDKELEILASEIFTK